MTSVRPLIVVIIALVSLLVAVVGAWAQQAGGGSVTAILTTAGGGFVGTAGLGLAALAYVGASQPPPPALQANVPAETSAW